MFIPIDNDKNFKKGDKVILLNETKNGYGVFTVGHKFIIDEIGTVKTILIDINGHKCDIQSLGDITKIIEANKAKENDEINKCKSVLFEELRYNCKHIGSNYDEYYYDSCSLICSDNECIPKSECFKYLSEESLKKKEIIIALRKLKIKNLLQ